MKKYLLLALVTTINTTAWAQLDCRIGPDHYKSVVKTVIAKTIKDDQIKIDGSAGALRVSISPVDIVKLDNESTTAKVTVTRSYHAIYHVRGPLQEKTEFTTKTTSDCKTAIINEKRTGDNFKINSTIESHLLKMALTDMLNSNDFVPANNHSGSMSLLLRMPERCAGNGLDYNVNIQRTHQQSSIISKVSTYLIDGDGLAIMKKEENYGKLLRNLCN